MEKQFRTFKLTELKPHPRNKSIYGENDTDEKYKQLVELIRVHGLRNRIIVNEDGVIISGHRRFRALKELGYTETECEVRHYDNPMEELRDLVMCNVGRRQQTRVQQLREGEAIHEVEAWKARQRMESGTNQYSPTDQSSLPLNSIEKGETRDIVAKIISWGTGAKNSGKDYSLGRSALKESDRLREEGNDDLANIIITQINKRGAHAAYDLAFKVDINKLNDVTMAGLRSGQISGRANTLPLKPEFEKKPKKEEQQKPITTFTKNEKSTITKADLDEVVQEYNAQSRGEIEIEIPEMQKGYVSKTIESAIREFKNKISQCMVHQREINNLDEEEKTRLNRIMTKFIEDFEKDKNYITGGM